MVQVFRPYESCPVGDRKLVIRGCDIDLVEANRSGCVPSDVVGVEPSSNGISDPLSIIGSPDDVFSSLRASNALNALKNMSHPANESQDK